MRVREVENDAERARLWDVAVAAFPPYAEYQRRTTRKIPSSSQSRRARV
jgi:phage head maturation protease